MISYKKIAFGAAVLATALPLAAQAATLTTDQMNSVVSLLQSFGVDTKTVGVVQMVLGHQPGTEASSTPWGQTPPGQTGKQMCIAFSRDLGVGSHGDDVKNLQQMLRDDQESGFEGTTTGFFGPKTAAAVKRFQMNNGIASTSTGVVGSLTRGFFERRCGMGLGNNQGDGKGKGSGVAGMPGAIVTGTITANSGSNITVQGEQSKLRVVNLTASTTIMVFTGTSTPPSQGSTADLVVGKTVMAEGTANTDGSITALHIRVGMLPPPQPMMMGSYGRPTEQ